MTEFYTPTDIGNRALQHCGAARMDPTLGFTELSKNAAEVGFVYGKLRRAELARNTWRMAIRRAVLRPIAATTLFLQPALWVQTTTYFMGSLVIDGQGNMWQSRIASNLNNQPLVSTTWEPYFGPLTVGPYDSTQSYFAGEPVYTLAGDGTYNTYISLVASNAVHPAVPNQWSAQTVYGKNQVVQQFPAWSSGTTYAAGAAVLFTDGNDYVSLVAGNLNHAPATSPAQWAPLPVLILSSATAPTSSPVNEWAIGSAYGLGAAVMFNGIAYVAIAASTGQFPNAAGSTSWAPVTGGTLYMSLINLNLGNSPASTFVAPWASATTYVIGNKVTGSDGLIYTSVTNANVAHDPTLDATGLNWSTAGKLSPWATAFTQGGGNSQWLQIGGASFPAGVALAPLNLISPLGAGPDIQSSPRNVFRLPAGFLRRAPADPKAGSTSYLGAPSGLMYDDWEFEGDYLVSSTNSPIVFHFVADLTDVSKMDDMFCEGLAARIAAAICEPLTQSAAKLEQIERAYTKVMSEARVVNAILIGSEEEPIDDWVAARL